MAKIEGVWKDGDVENSPLVQIRKVAGIEAIRSGQLNQVASLAVDEKTILAVFMLSPEILQQLPEKAFQAYIKDSCRIFCNIQLT